MTTLVPRKPYTEDELRKLYPPGLELQQVQILLRHGERTPVSHRFQKAGLQPFWPYCSAVRNMRDAVLVDAKNGGGKVFTTLEWKRRLETFGQGDNPVIATGVGGELDDVCDMGMLTDIGRVSTHELGKRFRDLYVDRLKFLPETVNSTDFMYLRSTAVPRALESLQQSFAGLYPAEARGPEFQTPTILIRSLNDETLFPNEGHCRRFVLLARAFAQRTADRWNSTEDMDYLNKIYGKWMPDNSPRVAVDGKPRLSGIMDTVNSTLAHGPETRLPKEFYDPRAREILERIGTEEWFAGFKESQEYRAVGIGSLMGDITSRMVGSVEKTTADGEYEVELQRQRQSGQHKAVKFGMSGCHDTTLAASLASLGAFNTDRWPPFTSHVAFELFRKANNNINTNTKDAAPGAAATATAAATAATHKVGSKLNSLVHPSRSPAAGQPPAGGIGRKSTEDLAEAEKEKLEGYYVRIRYNDEVVTIPGCKPAGKHLEGEESFCTLAAFKSIVDKFVPKDWMKSCRVGEDVPAFPAKPEPAGY
ncbi:hypothetical protein VMCG_00696 [Cytospora schulzeri]|uniref:3-phytase n=1 Tax=Cytospora schulzeri TaxID=448051 RepID=A0A423X8A0_9PEZI|nr:hypothetical protein VMCG_00696 [Valsa malicola]